MTDPFRIFTVKMAASFRRIAYASKVETVGDLYSDAWVVAHEIAQKRGRPVDFLDDTDQNIVMSWLYIRKVTRRDRVLREAVSIDIDSNGEGGLPSLIGRLRASSNSDPLTQLLSLELDRELAKKMTHSFSEAVAYARTFESFRHNHVKVCSHLAITPATLNSRVRKATHFFKSQRSLFDGKARISKRFVPKEGTRQLSVERYKVQSEQWAWSFDDPTEPLPVLTTRDEQAITVQPV